MSKNPPLTKLRDGLITATVWSNPSPEGRTRYSVVITRAYLKDDQWFESSSFSGNELLRVANLAQRAYRFIGAEQAKARNAQNERAAA